MELVNAVQLADKVKKEISKREESEFHKAREEVIKAIDAAATGLKYCCTVDSMTPKLKEELLVANYSVERMPTHQFSSGSVCTMWKISWNI